MSDILTIFKEKFGAPAEAVYSAAGRVNLIGEHVDYCGGKVLPAALTLKCRVAVRKNGTNFVRVAATDIPDFAALDLADLSAYKGLKWGSYQAGVADELQKAGYRLVGCDILYDCTVPFGSGLSSSAAIEVATAYALARLGGNPIDKPQLAVLCQKAENNYCGVNCGIMDQFASANGRAGHAILLDCDTLEYEYIPLDLQDCALVLSNCNKPHSLVASKYNERRAEVEEALAAVRGKFDAANLAAVTPAQLIACRADMRPVVYRRARHVVGECARVAESVRVLEAGDLAAFGKLLTASHISLRDDYEVTGAELDALAEAAWAAPGCLGSRMTGAGFGGCTVSLVRKADVEQFIQFVGARYRAAIGYDASFYVAEIADGIIDEADA